MGATLLLMPARVLDAAVPPPTRMVRMVVALVLLGAALWSSTWTADHDGARSRDHEHHSHQCGVARERAARAGAGARWPPILTRLASPALDGAQRFFAVLRAAFLRAVLPAVVSTFEVFAKSARWARL